MVSTASSSKDSVEEYLLSTSQCRKSSSSADSLEESTGSSESSENSTSNSSTNTSEPSNNQSIALSLNMSIGLKCVGNEQITNANACSKANGNSGANTSLPDGEETTISSNNPESTIISPDPAENECKHMKVWPRLRFSSKVLLGFVFLVPAFCFLSVFFRGILLLLQYRTFFGSKAPITLSPTHGVVVASANTSAHTFESMPTTSNAQTQASEPMNYHFKTYHPNIQLQKSLTKRPLRILIFGDSIARGVGHSQNCYPTMPETIGAVLSEQFGGRPVYWTAVGEPGATMGWIANQVQSSIRKYSKNDMTSLTMETFIDRHKDADDGSDNSTKNESIRAPNIETADQLDDQGQWINNLKFHKNLYSTNPFAGYDYIIALSGVNDIKRAAVPFLIEDDATSNDGTNVKDFFNLSGFYGDLHSFITGVKHISNSLNKSCKNDEALECRDSDQVNMPRIIFPSFPTEHVPAKTGSILRWIAVKSTGYLDSVKKSIADEHHNVYAVPCARDQDSLDFLEKKGSIWNAYREENVMLRLIDANEEVCQALVKEMDEFYSNKMAPRENNMIFNDLFSNDAMHPNDFGYDYYGRYLGKKIIERWETEDVRLK